MGSLSSLPSGCQLEVCCCCWYLNEYKSFCCNKNDVSKQNIFNFEGIFCWNSMYGNPGALLLSSVKSVRASRRVNARYTLSLSVTHRENLAPWWKFSPNPHTHTQSPHWVVCDYAISSFLLTSSYDRCAGFMKMRVVVKWIQSRGFFGNQTTIGFVGAREYIRYRLGAINKALYYYYYIIFARSTW